MLTRSKRRDAQSRIMATAHPLVSFPVEITTEIFLYCLPEVIDLMDPKVAPRLLMQICRRWRQIVLSLPKLWTSFRVDIHERLWQDELTACLTRSAGLPLDVILFSDRTHFMDHNEQLRMLSRYCNRIQHLKVDMPLYILCDLDEYWLQKHPRVQFAALEHLVLPEVSHRDNQIEFLEDDPIRMFADLPQLKSIHLSGIPLYSVAFPRTNIVRFNGVVYTVQEWVELLRSMPNLTDCAIHLDLELDDTWTATPFTHSALGSLQVRASALYRNVTALDLFSFLTFPALQSVDLQAGALGQCDRTLGLLAGRSPQLSTLSIVIPYYERDLARSFCNPFASLHTIIFQDAPSPFVKSFSKLFGADNTFLPNVRTLKFTGLVATHLVTTLAKLLGCGITKRRALQTPNCQLESLSISTERFSTLACEELIVRDCFNAFRQLKRDGLDVSVCWCTDQGIKEVPL
ncbi:hypothetical protein C8F01DRAFT_619849 [Mycena amicta]|nr:hypothetical protein C8F01DRAFT_619849 [Mycena amicta]